MENKENNYPLDEKEAREQDTAAADADHVKIG